MTEPIAKVFEEVIIFIAESLLGQKSEAEGVMLLIESAATILTALFTALGFIFIVIKGILTVIQHVVFTIINLLLTVGNIVKFIVELIKGGFNSDSFKKGLEAMNWVGFNLSDLFKKIGIDVPESVS